jgi:hypothetical protein
MKSAMIAQAFLSRLTPKLAAVVIIGFVLLPGLLVTNASGQAVEQPIVPYLSPGYRYLVVPQGGGPAGFEQSGFNDSGFSVGNAAFGNILGTVGCPPEPTVTLWETDTDILLRKTFTLPATASNVEVGVEIDNDIQVFINGVDISGLVQHEGCASRDSFVFPVPNNILVFGGTNLLAVRARDRGGISYVDVEVRADIDTDQPCVCKVTGGGQITLDSGESASFGFVAQREEENDPVSGHFNYLDHDTGRHINGPVEAITASAPTGPVTFSGTADDGDCTFTVTVEDKAEPGKGVDTFEMEGSCDPPVSQRAISRGNIQRHF